MKKRTWVFGALVVLVAAGVVVAAKRGDLWSGGAVAQAPRPVARAVPVEVATATKQTVPVRIEALGSVTPIASVAIKARIDSEIVGVHFRDGVMVREGDPLFTLDSRALQAQIRQVQGLLEGAKAQLEQAERDVSRYTELIAKNATTQVTLNNARTQVTLWRASVDSNTGQLENLNIQLSYCTIRAPITGRVSMAAVKIGNFVRQADLIPLATIIQTAPVYVTFSVSQGYLPDLRQALANESATIEAVIPGDTRRASGQVTMIENSVDAPTGMVPVRATMPNADELLWPGTLVTVRLTFREEQAVTVPSTAVQVSQTGTYVFVVDDGVAKVQPVTVARVVESESVISSGLSGGETVVTNGQLQLSNGTKVAPARTQGGVLAHEPLGDMYPPPGAHHADHRRDHCPGYLCLPAALGCGAPGRRLSHHQHHGHTAGRERGNHGGIGGGTDRTPAFNHRRNHVAYVFVVARHHFDHHPVRSQPQHRRRCAGRADRALCGAAAPAGGNDDAAELPKGQSGRLSDPVYQPESRRPCRFRRSTSMARSRWRSRFRSCPALPRC